jgi:hypothetical protein
VFPLALLLLALVKSESETVLHMNGLLFGALMIASGFLAYAATRKLRAPTPIRRVETLESIEAT